jgi:methylmalonyl-CoA mutase cobalamin-binding subunit
MTRMLAGAIGDCIHVMGIRNFLALAEEAGLETTFLGGTVSVEKFVDAVGELKPDVVGVSYRLSPGVCKHLLEPLMNALAERNLLEGRIYLFGGTVATGQVANELGCFDKIFDGRQSADEVRKYIFAMAGRSSGTTGEAHVPAQILVERIQEAHPVPLLRHHIGLASIDETVAAVEEIAEAGIIDVISIAPDQVAQESFFREEAQRTDHAGAGGVPIRTRKDLDRIFDATRRGNYPLCRCYSGTQDVLQWAELLSDSISNAWCAVPLSWYSELDLRGPRTLGQSIPEAHEVIRWHAERNIPVEVNEPHQWSLRRAPDSVAVAAAYLGAYTAKALGVKDYISQYMLNTPVGLTSAMDLAKILAMIELIESLHDDVFRSFREVRPGLASFPTEEPQACAQLSLSTLLGMVLKPDIFHVVATCEGRHEAGASDIIDSARLVAYLMERNLIDSPFAGLLDSPHVLRRKRQLIDDARAILDVIRESGRDAQDPLLSSSALEQAIRTGILDAPDLQGSGVAPGTIKTSIVDGACVAIETGTGRTLPESERLRQIIKKG